MFQTPRFLKSSTFAVFTMVIFAQLLLLPCIPALQLSYGNLLQQARLPAIIKRFEMPYNLNLTEYQDTQNTDTVSDTVKPFLDFETLLRPKISGTRNQKLFLNCKASGSPPPIIKWKFIASSTENKVLDFPDGVSFDQGTKELLGHVLNTRGVFGIDSTSKKNAFRDVMTDTNSIPKFRYSLRSRMFPLEFTRFSRRYKKRSLAHFKENNEDLPTGLYLNEKTDSHPQLGLSITHSRIVIDCLDESHAGTYVCVAKNGAKEINQSTKLTISDSESKTKSCNNMDPKEASTSMKNDMIAKFTKDEFPIGNKRELSKSNAPARIYMWTANRVENQGTDVIIFCRSSGNPTPKVGWLTPEGEVVKNGSKYQILNNGDLVVRNIEWNTDMGSYVCLSHNRYGTDFKKAFLYPVSLNSVEDQ